MAKGDDGKYTSKSSFTKINTQTEDKDGNAVYAWKEYKFVIRGSFTEESICHLKITFGTGDRWTSSTLASGALFVSVLSMDTMTYNEWSDVSTSTYINSVSFVSSSVSSFTNGTMNELDMKETEFGDSGYLADSTKVGKPESWSISDSTKDGAVTGVLQLKDNGGDDLAHRYACSDQITAVLGDDAAIKDAFNGLYSDIGASLSAGYYGAPNLLTIASQTNPYSLGYLSKCLAHFLRVKK